MLHQAHPSWPSSPFRTVAMLCLGVLLMLVCLDLARGVLYVAASARAALLRGASATAAAAAAKGLSSAVPSGVIIVFKRIVSWLYSIGIGAGACVAFGAVSGLAAGGSIVAFAAVRRNKDKMSSVFWVLFIVFLTVYFFWGLALSRSASSELLRISEIGLSAHDRTIASAAWANSHADTPSALDIPTALMIICGWVAYLIFFLRTVKKPFGIH